MADIVVTSVGAIDGLAFGTTDLYSTWTVVDCSGFDAAVLGHTSVFLDLSGRLISLGFTDVVDSGLNFNFGDSAGIVVAGALDNFVSGAQVVYSTWLVCETAGFDLAAFGLPKVNSYPFEVSFDFTETGNSNLALNMSWGGLTLATAGVDHFTAGDFLIETAGDIGGQGILSFAAGSCFAHYDTELYLNFVDPVIQDANFYFDDRIVVRAGNYTTGSVGTAAVENKQTVCAPAGIAGLQLGVAFAADPSAYLLLNFHYIETFNAENIAFYFGDAKGVGPYAVDSAEFGETFVSNALRRVTTFGWRSWQFGTAEFALDGLLRPQVTGFVDLRFGEPSLHNASLLIEFFAEFGVDTPPQTQWGLFDVVSVQKQYIYTGYTVSGQDEPVIDIAPYTQWPCEDEEECYFQVAHHTRWISQHDPQGGAYVGTPYVGFYDQTIFVPWFQPTVFGTALLGRNTEIQLTGLSPPGCGVPKVIYGNVLYPTWPGSNIVVGGASRVSRSPQIVYTVQRTGSFAAGTQHVIYNSHQVIVLSGVPEYNHAAQYGDSHWIWNANRTLTVMGLNSLRMPVQFEGVFNAGRALVVVGTDFTQYGQNTFIADAIRYITLPGWDSLYVARYGTLVGNAARNLTPVGIDDSAQFGLNVVWSNLQWLRHKLGWVGEVGLPYIDYAVRTITQYPFNYTLTSFGVHYVGNLEQIVDLTPLGPYDFNRGDLLRIGEFIVSGPFKRGFAPRWPNQPDAIGTARVWNFNPQAWPVGIYAYGAAERIWVSHSPRELAPLYITEPSFPRPSVQFRDRTFAAVGWHSLLFGTTTAVRNAVPDPPVNLYVYPQTVCVYSCQAFGSIHAQNNSIVVSGINATAYGQPWVRSQGVLVRTYEHSSRFGIPIIGATQWLTVQPFELVEEGPFWDVINKPQATQWGKPQISPQTVWMQNPAPRQAVTNHAGGLFIWPTCLSSNSCSPFMGTPTATLENRIIYASGSASYTAGTAKVYLKKQAAAVVSISSLGVGFPVLIPHLQKVYLVGTDSLKTNTGATVVNAFIPAPPDQVAYFTGSSFTAWGSFDSKPKWITGRGFESTQWGNNNPMVHFPRHLYVQSFIASQFGNNWPSHKIRYFGMPGIDIPLWWMSDFTQRMQVKGGKQTTGRMVFTTGFDSMEVGEVDAAETFNEIIPFMIAPPCIPCCVFEITTQ